MKGHANKVYRLKKIFMGLSKLQEHGILEYIHSWLVMGLVKVAMSPHCIKK